MFYFGLNPLFTYPSFQKRYFCLSALARVKKKQQQKQQQQQNKNKYKNKKQI